VGKTGAQKPLFSKVLRGGFTSSESIEIIRSTEERCGKEKLDTEKKSGKDGRIEGKLVRLMHAPGLGVENNAENRVTVKSFGER